MLKYINQLFRSVVIAITLCFPIASYSLVSKVIEKNNLHLDVVGGLTTALGVAGFTLNSQYYNIAKELSVDGEKILFKLRKARFLKIGLIGMVILDEESEGNLSFPQISENDAETLNLSSTELISYNNPSALSALNTIADDIYSKTYEKNMNHSEIAELWIENLESNIFSPVFISALKKVVSKFNYTGTDI